MRDASWTSGSGRERPVAGPRPGSSQSWWPAERKRALFAEAFELLEPGGVFVNMDYVSIEGPLQGPFDEEMRAKAVDHEHASGGTRSAEEVDIEDDDDRPDSVADQLRWLREAGFEQVEVHFKWAEAAVYGGARPKGDV